MSLPRFARLFPKTKVSNWTQVSFGGAGVVEEDFAASGGNSTGSYSSGGNTYSYHKFTSTGNFTVTAGSSDIEFFMVGGGAGGGEGKPVALKTINTLTGKVESANFPFSGIPKRVYKAQVA